MSAAPFLLELRRRDIQVWLDGDHLRCNARAGALTDELREELRQRKSEIVHFLRTAQQVATQQRAIVPLQQNGVLVPVFAVPGHNGDVFCYRALAQSLGDQQPFFGLQAPGLDGQAEPLERINALAAYFASQIRGFQPQGPYIIAGFCAGGTVAFELAQQLLAIGETVGFLALFGSPFPKFFRPFDQFQRLVKRRTRDLANHARILASRSWRERWQYLQAKLQREKGTARTTDPVLKLRARVEEATLSAVRAYTPQFFPGRVCLFLPSTQWASSGFRALGWRAVAPRVEEYFGPDGCTSDDMLLAANAPRFAELFRTACTATPPVWRPVADSQLTQAPFPLPPSAGFPPRSSAAS
jgi:thioesterase domain-containing protein